MRRPSTSPLLLGGVLSLCAFPSPSQAEFIRGDADRDGAVKLADAVAVLTALFQSGEPLPCPDAADSNDDGELDIADAIGTLLYLFAGDWSLPNPGPLVPGPDPTCDRLDCWDSPDLTPAVLLSEIMYNSQGGSAFDYVELHNRSAEAIDVSGYAFSNGIEFVIPPGTVMPSGGFLVVAKDPRKFRLLPVVGPYAGDLADGGERLTLVSGDCMIESLRYDDRSPWPLGADGYGSALERVSYLAPAHDLHSWRASLRENGTPGRENSTLGTPTYPLIGSAEVRPAAPSSSDAVEVRVAFDLPAGEIAKATLRSRTVAVGGGFDLLASEMLLIDGGDGFSVFAATVPPQPSQSLVRYNMLVDLTSGASVLLPHEAEPRPVLGYFVYDFEIGQELPLLWLVPARREGLYENGAAIGGAVVVEPGSRAPLVFDGAELRSSNNGQKLRFLKGEEYRGDRTVNLLPSAGNPSSGGGALGPQQEQFGFQVFRDAGAMAARADWFRVIEYVNPLAGHRHSQRAMVQQVNERFLLQNGLSDGGDLYKLDKGIFEKHTNEDTGDQSIQALRRSLATANPQAIRDFVLANFDLENIRLYSVLGVFMANWDGFHNNMYLYHSLEPSGRWMVFPWDLDQVFQPENAEFLLTFPKDGNGGGVARPAGFLSRPYHAVPELDQAYVDALREGIQPGGPLSVGALVEKSRRIEQTLLEDLALLEAFTEEPHPERREQIVNSYASIRRFIEARVAYLRQVLQ